MKLVGTSQITYMTILFYQNRRIKERDERKVKKMDILKLYKQTLKYPTPQLSLASCQIHPHI
jgi:hypothetical protein